MSWVETLPLARRSGRQRRRARFDTVERVCLVVIALLLIIALFGPLLAPENPDHLDLLAIGAGPSSAHWLGTDDVGRDNLSRLLVGARTTLLGAAAIVSVAVLAGTFLALLTAWKGGLVDRVTMPVLNLMFAFPALLLAILAAAIFGAGLTTPIIALSIAYTPYIARIARGAALRERHLPYVEAMVVMGHGGFRTTARHILPNIGALVIALATVTYGYAVMDLAAVSFLGLGVQPPTADWGVMVSDGQQGIFTGSPYEALFAGGAIVLAVVATTVLGNRRMSRLT